MSAHAHRFVRQLEESQDGGVGSNFKCVVLRNSPLSTSRRPVIMSWDNQKPKGCISYEDLHFGNDSAFGMLCGAGVVPDSLIRGHRIALFSCLQMFSVKYYVSSKPWLSTADLLGSLKVLDVVWQ